MLEASQVVAEVCIAPSLVCLCPAIYKVGSPFWAEVDRPIEVGRKIEVDRLIEAGQKNFAEDLPQAVVQGSRSVPS